jgi:predicted DNA-binding transcriptional regulator YafY
VYRDVKALEEAGVPIIGEAGIGYSIMEGYRLPPVMFTREEATAFLTAEKLIEKLTDTSTDDSYKSAMYKVRAVLRSTEKDLLENIEEHIEVLKTTPQANTPFAASPIQTILKSIPGKNVVYMQYAALGSPATTERHVEPVGIFFQGNFWYLIAFCRLRNDYRNFRIDRITKIRQCDERFKTEHGALKSYLKRVATDQELFTIVMRVQKTSLRYLEMQKYYYGFVSQQDVEADKVDMTFLTAYLEGFARWYIMFGDRAEIIEPTQLNDRIKELLAAMLQKMQPLV